MTSLDDDVYILSMTSHDPAGGDASADATHSATNASEASSRSAPPTRRLLRFRLPSLLLSEPFRRSPSFRYALDAGAVARRRLLVGFDSGCSRSFRTGFLLTLTSLSVGFDQLQQLVKHLRFTQ